MYEGSGRKQRRGKRADGEDEGLAALVGCEVSGIRAVRGDGDRVSVRVGRQSAGVVSRERLHELGIEVGVVLDEGLIGRLGEAVAEEGAYRYGVRVVTRRMIGRWELEEKMRRRGYELGVAKGVVERMAGEGLMDDEAYGRAVVAGVLMRKAAGPGLLRAKLIAKRLDRELIDRLVREAGVGRDEVAEARELVEKKMRGASMRKLDAVKRDRRLQGMLARRGFGGGVIREAMKGVERGLSGENAEGD